MVKADRATRAQVKELSPLERIALIQARVAASATLADQLTRIDALPEDERAMARFTLLWPLRDHCLAIEAEAQALTDAVYLAYRKSWVWYPDYLPYADERMAQRLGEERAASILARTP